MKSQTFRDLDLHGFLRYPKLKLTLQAILTLRGFTRKLKFFLTIFFFLFATYFVLSIPVTAQETPEELAKKYNVTFPVAELGNCSNVAECRTYCGDPINQTACVNFAKAKGFYKEELSQRQQELLNTAKTELGCTDIVGCQALCHQQENFEKCNTFARKHGVSGGHVEDPAKQEIVKKAQEILGCDSAQSCKTLCGQEQNREKCDSFAKQVGLRGGESRQGPGGCTSEETCKTFCSDPNNYQVCQGFSQGSGGKFKGPGGCDSEASCRDYCQKNPQECGYGGPRPTGAYNPQEMCLRTPSCRWANNTCECGFYNALESGKKAEEYAKFCREHPDQCQPGQLGGFVSSDNRQQFEQYCRENPDKCRKQFERKEEAENCFRSGKYWYNETCNDNPQTGGYGSPYPTGGPYPTGDYPRPTYYPCQPPASGCSGNTTWDRGTCTCKPPCPAATSWDGGTCMKDSSSYGGGYSEGTSSCPPPASGCGADKTWDRGTCTCKPSCPSGTSWTGGYCMQDSSPVSGGNYTQPTYSPPTSYPQTNSPEQECRNRSGCRWEDNTCKCESSGGTSSGESPEQMCTKTSGCRWENNSCRCESSGGTSGGTSGESPEQMCGKTPGCSWSDNTCKCTPQVQGASSPRNFFESFFQFLNSLFQSY
ncbi:hypothetical protein HY612_02745 [Candidatus Roizmanbacteria bacterium]|nr:hypothetical protein [Candidatus Roizmanbacteria bacterium]